MKGPKTLGSDDICQKITLTELLKDERDRAIKFKNQISDTKVSMTYYTKRKMSNYELSRREFLIKTCQLDISSNALENNKKFMHIFVETTQISQLEEARAQNKYQKQMLANVSHEFRTPLNAMSMSLVLLKNSIKGPDQKFLKIANSS